MTVSTRVQDYGMAGCCFNVIRAMHSRVFINDSSRGSSRQRQGFRKVLSSPRSFILGRLYAKAKLTLADASMTRIGRAAPTHRDSLLQELDQAHVQVCMCEIAAM